MNLENNELMVPEFLLSMLEEQYEKDMIKKIIVGYTKNRVVTLRVNTLKTTPDIVKDQFIKLGIEFEKVKFTPEAFIIKNVREKDIQVLDMYKNGEIYLQSLSSMLPPIVLNPKQDADILDMAAAPGGKTTQMAAISMNKAHITACEMNAIRAERLKYNIEKQGASCVYVMVTDARNIDNYFSFDQILLDAPCSGSGTLCIKEKNDISYFNMKLIRKSTSAQLALLKKAINILKPGKEMVYSTCSILQCENEDIINEALKSCNAEIVPIKLEGLEEVPCLPVKIKGTLCICPNELFEGFYIAKIRKKLK